jgi:hypothetical protein
MSTHQSFGVHAPITPAQQLELDAPTVESFGIENLNPRERSAALALTQQVTALCLKALLNRIEPGKFPVSTNPMSFEARAAAFAHTLPAATLAQLAPGLRTLIRSPDRLRTLLGESGLALNDLQTAGIEARLGLRIPALTLPKAPAAPPRKSPPPPAPAPSPAPVFNRAHLMLRAIHCVRETQPPGRDEIIFGGMRIGASGNVAVINSFDAGNFRTGTYADYGELFLGQYNLNAVSAFPKHLFAVFQLVESDSNDAKVARALTDALSSLAGIVVGFFATAAAGVAAASAVGLIGNLIGAMIDEDAMRPHGIRLTLTTPNPFGSSGVGPKVHTGDITGHGGRYRIGYRWVLGA